MHATSWRRSSGERGGGGRRRWRPAGQALSGHLPRRLNQQQLLDLRVQVEDLQKALKEQGGKTEDVSAHLLPAWPSLLSPNNPLFFPHLLPDAPRSLL